MVYMSFFVYLLSTTATSGQQTYVGATVDLDHRLRQHNKEIKGGAHATSIQVERGATWERVCHVAGFPTWPAAHHFEWRWKQISRGLHGKPLERRFDALQTLLGLERPTTAAIPYSEYPEFPDVIMEKNNTI